MSVCPGCGGVVGRDCFNPQECEWICGDMEARAYQEAADRERERAEHLRYCEREEENFYASMQMDKWVEDDLGPFAFTGATR